MKQFSMMWLVLWMFSLILTMAADSDTWPNEVLVWPPDYPQTNILQSEKIKPIPRTTLKKFIEKSNDFPIKFPESFTRCALLQTRTDPKILENYINSAYPVVHEQVLRLILSFLNQKNRFGSSKERQFYQNMTVVGLIDRLLTKRAVSFVDEDDQYLLIDGTRGQGQWSTVGTDEEKPPLLLENCLSYDEMQISSLLSVSSQSFFIKNDQVAGNGVVIGAVGPRLNKEGALEYREIMKTKQQNTHVNGYGQFFVPTVQGIFTNFYGDISATYDEWQMGKAFDDTTRYIKIDEHRYFDKLVYDKRVALSIDCLLLDANERAKQQNTNAYVHVVGLGLQEWKITLEENHLFVEVVKKRVKFLGKILTCITDIIFTEVGQESVNEKVLIENHPNKGITLQTKDQRPDRCTEDDQGKLIVISYNWNGNSIAGNKFWLHNSSTFDGAVKHTQITEIHNPFINPNLRAANLRIATVEGIVTFPDYVNNIK